MQTEINKILPVNKPIGFSTFDLIRIFKRETKFSGKIGHGGTLDPFATGVVLLLLGKATSRFEEIKHWEKVYLGGIKLGAVSSTQDIAGEIKINKEFDFSKISKSHIEKVLKEFIGETLQKVPFYSAAKFKGTPLYKLAKRGIFVEKSKKVVISEIEFISFKWPLLSIRVYCSGGVYIRQLSADIGEKLGSGGFLYFLEREKVGNFTLSDCLFIEDFQRELG